MAVEPDEQDGEDLVRKCEDERYERQQAVYVAEDVIPIQDGTDGRRSGDRQRDAGQHCEEARKFGNADERPYGRSVGLDLSVGCIDHNHGGGKCPSTEACAEN